MEAPTRRTSLLFLLRKLVDFFVRSNEIEVDEDDLNEGFCHYSIINDDE